MVHEALDMPAHVPYHRARLRHMPVLEICGRKRGYEPKCANEESLWCWWKDIDCYINCFLNNKIAVLFMHVSTFSNSGIFVCVIVCL